MNWAICLLAFAPLASAQVQSAAPANPPIDGHARLQWLLDENLSIEFRTGRCPRRRSPDLPQDAEGVRHALGRLRRAHRPDYRELRAQEHHGSDARQHVGRRSALFPHRAGDVPLKGRVGYVIRMTFMAHNRNGKDMPAYARFIAFPASSFISNEWTPHSQSNTSDAAIRVGLGFLSRMGENAWKEFIVKRH